MKLWKILYLPAHLGNTWYESSRYVEARTMRSAINKAKKLHPLHAVIVECIGEAWT